MKNFDNYTKIVEFPQNVKKWRGKNCGLKFKIGQSGYNHIRYKLKN